MMSQYPKQPVAALVGILLLLSVIAWSGCASMEFARPPVQEPEEESLGPPPPPDLQDDPIRHSYTAFALSALHGVHGRYETALDHLQKAIEYDPNSVFLLRRAALLLKQLKRNEEAMAYAEKCAVLEPETEEHHLLVGEIAGLLNREDEAIRAYARALEIHPEHTRARLVMTTLLIKNQAYDQALNQLDRVIDQDPNLVIAHYYRGRVFLETGNPERSEEAYLEALRLNERMEPALFDLGSMYQMQGRFDKAAEIYERLIDYYPVNMTVRERLVDLYYRLEREGEAEKHMEAIKGRSKPGEQARQSLGLIYLRHGKLDESITELDMIVQAWPDDDKSRYFLASAHEERGDMDEALAHFQRLKAGSEYYLNAQLHIAYILDAQEETEEAEAVLRRALVDGNDKEELFLMLASILEGQEKLAEAQTVLSEGLKLHPRSAELVFRLGVILDKSGEKEASLEQMRLVLDIDPDHADAMNYIGYTYAEQGVRLDEALNLIQQALRIKPESGYITDSLGWVYFQKGEYEEALKHLERAASLQPEDPTIAEHLGDVYMKQGMHEKALEAYTRALELNHTDPEAIQEKMDRVRELPQGNEKD